MRELKKFYIRTYGCQMNELDTEVMAGMLRRRGLERTDDEAEADLLLFNTCSIRDLAERKALGKIGRLGGRKGDVVIGVTGCMANAKKASLLEKVPHIDFVLGTNNIHNLNAVLNEVLETGQQVVRTDPVFQEELEYVEADRPDRVKAFVSIIRGCDKFCTYCVVPYTRGREVSRPAELIVEECRQLAARGVREITLLGQNVNSYGKDRPEWQMRFHDLLYRLDKIEGIDRVRFMTSHPVDITRELMEAIRDLPTVCEFVHFPIQAGSNRILRKMHRIYTKEHYLEKVALLRELVPDVALGTDIIVGFPTETEKEFEETLQVFEEIDYQVAFLFAYSARKGTPAKRWRDDVPEEVKQARLQRLLTLYNRMTARRRRVSIGTTVEVLVERRSRDPRLLKGRTRQWQKVLLEGEDSLIGTLQKVWIHSCSAQTLLGDLVKPPAHPLSLIAG